MPPLLPDTDHRPEPRVTPVTEVVEAPTAEEAVAAVHRRFGESARIVGAEKVLRGGIGGFFARELVQLTVELPSHDSPSGDVRVLRTGPSDGASAVTTAARAGDEGGGSARYAVVTGGTVSTGRRPDRVDGPARRRASARPEAAEERNPLRAALAAGVDDGPPGETFGELLDRRAAARRDDERSPVGGGRAASLGGAVGRLARETEERERSFGDALRAAIEGERPEVVEEEWVEAARVADVGDATSSSSDPHRPPTATVAGDEGTILRGAASLIATTGSRGGASELVARADRLAPASSTATTVEPGPDPGSARLASARAAASARIEAAIEAASQRTAPVAERPVVSEVRPTATDEHPASDRLDGRELATGAPGPDVATAGPGPDVAAAAPATDPATGSVATAGGDAGDPVELGPDSPVVVDDEPLAGRHEAFRQLRACVDDLSVEVATPARATRRRRVRTIDASAASSAWSADALARAGAPGCVIDAALALHPEDDVQWLGALARGLEPLCGPLPAGPEVVVGPRAARVAPHLAAEVVTPDTPAPAMRTVVLGHRRTPDARRWLAEERGDRGLHLVVGGTGWRDWLFELPDVVSWTRDDDLTDALEVAARFGITLGWRLRRDAAHRATAIDLAVALRARVVGG